MGDDAARHHVGAIADARRVMADGRGSDAKFLQVIEATNPGAVAANASIVEDRCGDLEFHREIGSIDPPCDALTITAPAASGPTG